MITSRKDRPANGFFRQHGLCTTELCLPNVNLYCEASALLSTDLLSHVDHKYICNFKRFWHKQQGKITTKNKRRIMGIIKYYTQVQQNTALRNARLNRKKNLKLNGTKAEKC